MRLGDLDALKEDLKRYFTNGEALYQILTIIDNAPTVELTEEQAIDKLHETGWLIRHDKEMTERPKGEYEIACNVLLSLEQIVRKSDGWEDSAVEAVHNAVQTAIKCMHEIPQGEWIDYDNTFYKCPDCGYLLEKCCPQCQNKVILPKGGAV